jgi:uncharacterized membrane protein YgdD (TMEM256/DUF423 family)
MNSSFFKIGALLGAISVILGAFAAHGLKSRLPLDAVAVFETGVRYQFYHAFALLILGLAADKLSPKWLNLSGKSFIIGVLLFSGSLYLLTFLKAAGATAMLKYAGIITPFGGLAFIAGWVFLFLASYKK